MSPLYSLPPRPGAFSRFLSLVAVLATLAFSFFLGVIVFFAILGLVLVIALVVYLRLRWLRHRMGTQRPAAGKGATLEGEYTVSKRSRDR
jgi:predicted lipid-binding transport protein (Tim44 family)